MSAVQQLLTDHIHIWTAAETEKRSARGRVSGNAASVYGIKKLRGLILDLAVRGKLVPQDTNDESASELFKRIQAEKEKLIIDGIIKKSKPLPEIAVAGLFALPEKWLWVRLGDVCSYIQRGKGPDYVETSDFTVISQKCVQWAGLDLSQARSIDPKSFNKYESIRILREGDILWNSTGTGTIGRACLVPQLENQKTLIADSHVTVVRKIGFLGDYLWRWIQSPTVQSEIEGVASGTTNQIELNTSTVISHPVPLPPLNEQRRIIEKVDELMNLCDKLEAQHSDAADAHQQLVSHLLGTLTQSQSAATFNANWQRIAAHFNTLFTTEASIETLKQTVMQLGVMGKLVGQDANDEPASELFKRIQAEKSELITQGKIKKDKAFAEISKKNMVFELPKSWEWAHIGELALSTDYGLSEQTFDTLNGIPVVKMGDIQDGKVILGGQKKVSENIEGLPDLYLKTGDLLYNRTNSAELVGKTGVFQGPDEKYTFASYLIRIRCFKDLFLPSYLNLAMNTPLFRKTQIDPHLKQQCGQANVNGTIMKNMIVPFPSFAEQRRICAKVDELMALCDQLKCHIANVNQHKKNLADVLVEHAVDG